MANIEELQRALRQGSDAKARLSGLDEQYQQAQDRGVATTKKDQYGQVSPLSVLADVVGQSRSRRDMRELAPQREAARSNIAQHENAGALYNAVRQQKRDNVSDEQFGITHGLNKSKQAEVARQNQIKNDRYTTEQGQVKTPPVEYTDAEGNTRQLVSLGDGRWKDENRNIITSIAGWTKAADKTKDVSGSGYSNDWERKEFQKLLNTSTELAHISGKADNLSQSDLKLMNDKGTVFKQLLIKGVTPNLFDQFRKENYTGLSKSAQDFLTQINMMDSERRHALFGAALTGNENAKFDDIALAAKGLSIGKMLDRLSIVAESNQDKVVNLDTTSPHFKGTPIYENRQKEIGDKYTPAWSGSYSAQVTEDQWNELSRKQKIALSSQFKGDSKVNANLTGSPEDIQSEDGTPSADAKTLDQYRDRTPPEALAMLRANPELLADFIESYGWNPDEETTR